MRGNWRDVSVVKFIRQLMAEKPSLSFMKAKEIAVGMPRIRYSSNVPHQSLREKTRRLRQASEGKCHNMPLCAQ